MPVDIQQIDTAGTCAVTSATPFCSPAISMNASFTRQATIGGTAGTAAVSSPSQNSGDVRGGVIGEWVPAAGSTWGAGNWTHAWLAAKYQATPVVTGGETPVLYLRNPDGVPADARAKARDLHRSPILPRPASRG